MSGLFRAILFGMLFYNLAKIFPKPLRSATGLVFSLFGNSNFTFFCEFRLESRFFCFSVDDVDFNESDLYPSDDSNEMRVSEREKLDQISYH